MVTPRKTALESIMLWSIDDCGPRTFESRKVYMGGMAWPKNVVDQGFVPMKRRRQIRTCPNARPSCLPGSHSTKVNYHVDAESSGKVKIQIFKKNKAGNKKKSKNWVKVSLIPLIFKKKFTYTTIKLLFFYDVTKIGPCHLISLDYVTNLSMTLIQHLA